MRVLSEVALILLLAISPLSWADENSDTQASFNRESAIEQHKSICHPELSLAMGTASKRREGSSQAEQIRDIETNSVASDETKTILLEIVNELYSVPEIGGGTYVFYRFESCLIQRWFGDDRGPIADVSDRLLKCQNSAPADELGKLAACIDAELIESRERG